MSSCIGQWSVRDWTRPLWASEDIRRALWDPLVVQTFTQGCCLLSIFVVFVVYVYSVCKTSVATHLRSKTGDANASLGNVSTKRVIVLKPSLGEQQRTGSLSTSFLSRVLLTALC